MRKFTLLLVVVLTVITSFAQNKTLPRQGLPQAKAINHTLVSNEPISSAPIPTANYTEGEKLGSKGIVSVIPIGTSANAYSYGYAGGQKTMVWADDNLKAIINIHRMGPGSTPPSFSGYLGIDRGLNFGATPGDWTQQLPGLCCSDSRRAVLPRRSSLSSGCHLQS